jgi:hypothetical protein
VNGDARGSSEYLKKNLPTKALTPPATPSPAIRRVLPWLVAVAFFMEPLDTTILNTAVPIVAKAIGTTPLSMKAVLASCTLSRVVARPSGYSPCG